MKNAAKKHVAGELLEGLPFAPVTTGEPQPETLGDLRFRSLLGSDDWSRLPHLVRRRFSERLAGGRAVTYVGMVKETRMSRVGWCLAQMARFMGGPLPICVDSGVPAVVTVTEDEAGSGQFWTRIYGRHQDFPQVIHSSKRFAGPTGLEEYIGRGIGMALTVHVEDGALLFKSAGFFLQLFGWRVSLPRWLQSLKLTVSHIDNGLGRFTFVLDLRHALLGELIHQTAVFADGE